MRSLLMRLAFALSAWICVPLAEPAAAALLGTGFTYQGQLRQNNQAVTGNVDFSFSLWDAPGGGDPPTGGIQIGAAQTVLTVSVTDGLFTVELNAGGEFGARAFNGDARWLQIAVRSPAGSGAYTTLSPRQPVTAAPYALRSLSASALPLPFTGSASYIFGPLFTITNTSATGSAGGIRGNSASASGTGVAGIATATTGATTGVYGQSDSTSGRAILGLALAGSGTTSGVYGQSISTSGRAIFGQASATSGTNYGVYGETSSPSGYGGYFLGRGYFSGNLGLGTTAPQRRLHVADPQAIAVMTSSNSTNGSVLEMRNDTTSPTFLGAINFLASTSTVGQIGYRAADQAISFTTNAGERARFEAAGGRLRSNSFTNLLLTGSSDDAFIDLVKNTGTTPSARILFNGFSDQNTHQASIEFFTRRSTDPLGSISRRAEITSDGNVNFYNATGVATVRVLGDLGNGLGRVVTPTLQITGGSDLAEPFAVVEEEGDQKIEPGMVVIIDSDRPGQVKMAGEPYDRKVAGIISGANGINPGLTMHQEGTTASGSLPVALTGRVYCWCDAASGGIRPGDLLTTSATPGHAMKVTDYSRSPGAVLGKAMTALQSGRGLVLVLVALQ